MNLYQHAKNQFIPSVHCSDTVSFKVPSHDLPHQFLIMPTSKTFKLIFMKLYQHAKRSWIPLVNSILESKWPGWPDQYAKSETASSIFSGEMVHLEILQSDWLREQEQSQEQDFSQRICTGTQQIKVFNIE